MTFFEQVIQTQNKADRSSHGHWSVHIVKSQSLVPKPWLTESLVRRFAVEFILPLILEANYPIWQTQFWQGINPKILRIYSLLSHCA